MNKLQAVVAGIILSAAAIYIVFFTKPDSVYIVILLILIVTFLAYTVLTVFSKFVSATSRYLVTLFIGMFLLINYLAGFQLINTILLISFIIGLSLLTK